jgi:transcriptional regulator with XRE-family HTH domain
MAPTTQPQPALGEAVRQFREKRGDTQEALASKAGITLSTLSVIERGRANPTWGTVRRIATALEAPMGELGRLVEKLEK